MKWAATISTEVTLDDAVSDAAAGLAAELGNAAPEVVLAFSTPHHQASWKALPGLLADAFPGAAVLGCSGGGTLAGGREVEGGHALAIAAGHLPGVEAIPFHVAADEAPDTNEAESFWRRRLNIASGTEPDFLLLPEPYSCDAAPLLAGLDRAFPSSTKVGGLASGARASGDNVLLLGDGLHRDGTVGLALTGNLKLDTIVAQGCRPIGNPLFITAIDGPLVIELDGRRPTDVLGEIYESLPPRDQELLRHSLFLGVVMRPHQVEYGHGDFLIRNLAGIDPETGALAIAAELEQGQVVQFHLRDSETSARDLQAHLEAYAASMTTRPAGALLFSCLGRGEFLYGEPDHDSAAFLAAVGSIPLAGFFCNGEIGPVQGTTFLHGYTSAFALFRPRE